jgi:hypothetical protein
MENEHEFISDDGKVMVAIENIGEGKSGDYNPDDPADVNYYRFSVYRKYTAGEEIKPYFTDVLPNESGEPVIFEGDDEWLAVNDASYCTAIRVDAPQQLVEKLGREILAAVESEVRSQNSVKRLCENLSWTNSDKELVLGLALTMNQGKTRDTSDGGQRRRPRSFVQRSGVDGR